MTYADGRSDGSQPVDCELFMGVAPQVGFAPASNERKRVAAWL